MRMSLRLSSMSFNRPALMSASDRVARRTLFKFGGFVRTTAKRSIKKRKSASRPGRPPSSHTGGLRDPMAFNVNMTTRDVVVGPPLTRKRGSRPVPELLEKGGTVRFNRKRVFIKKVGRDESGKFRSDGHWVTLDGPVRIEARPFMEPAGNAGVAMLPKFIKESRERGSRKRR